ncbi:hypothetical protein ACA910_018193 [Epithemia clementina (nom. ined.)]
MRISIVIPVQKRLTRVDKGKRKEPIRPARVLMQYLFQMLPQLQQSHTNTNKPIIALTCHLDLHKTTNSETEFRPANFARAGLPYQRNRIPDGFYWWAIQ